MFIPFTFCKMKILSMLPLWIEIYGTCLSAIPSEQSVRNKTNSPVFEVLLMLVWSTAKQEMQASYSCKRMLHSTSSSNTFPIGCQSISCKGPFLLLQTIACINTIHLKDQYNPTDIKIFKMLI